MYFSTQYFFLTQKITCFYAKSSINKIRHKQINQFIKDYMDFEQKLGKIQILICLHIQATCENKVELKPCQQTIEMTASAIFLNSEGAKQIGRFHKFIKPQCNPKLSQFCCEITGLNDAVLKGQKGIDVVMKQLESWIKDIKGLKQNNYTFVTWGSWTLQKGLLKQLKTKKLETPHFLHSYTDFKRTCISIFNQPSPTLPNLFNTLSLPPTLQNETKSEQTIKQLTNILIKLYNDKKYIPSRKLITIIHDIPNVNVTNQLQYLLVLDFQATCQDGVKLKPCSEIIQFPVMVVCLKERKIVSQFHFYVEPVFNGKLSQFCTELTGITQQMVDKQPKLEEVLVRLDQWILSQQYLESKNFTFVTCGDWDLCSCLKTQAKCKNIEVADYLKNYINIKNVFKLCLPQFDGSMGMMGMLKGLDIAHKGRHHSGIDDVRNICQVCIGLINKKGFKFEKQHIKYIK